MVPSLDEIVCVSQGLVFAYANDNGYDMATFTEEFLCSDFCRREWDADSSWYQFAHATQTMKFLIKECHLKKGKTYAHDVMYWVGYMYRLMAQTYHLPSRIVFQHISFDHMLDGFLSYHILAFTVAAKYLHEDYWLER